jgi:hypothetical protein
MPAPLNGFFDSKVMSRKHAEIWADKNGKIWIRDTKSSNGTFINGQRLSKENRDSDPHELCKRDLLELGIDIVSEDQKTVVQHKVAARVEYVGSYTYERTPLSWAAESGHKAVVQLLLEKGVDTDSKDNDGRTPRSYAVDGGHEAVIQLLLEGRRRC